MPLNHECCEGNEEGICPKNEGRYYGYSGTAAEVENEELDVEESDGVCSVQDVITSGHILEEVRKNPRRQKKPVLCPWTCHVRYENIIPKEVINDHQYSASTKKSVTEQMCNLRVTSEPFWKRQPGIIATLGPSCSTVVQIESLIQAGMNVARVNMAYGNCCSQKRLFENIRKAEQNFSARVGFRIPIGTLMDLKGPEIRTGKIHRPYIKDLDNPEINLKKGSNVKLTVDRYYNDKCSPKIIYVDYEPFPKVVRPGMKIYISDGLIKLAAESVENREVNCFIEDGGILRNFQPLHLPMVPNVYPVITENDIDDIDLAIQQEVDFIAVSKVRSAAPIKELKGKIVEKLLVAKKMREKSIMILSKISNFEALQNIDEIIEASDGVIIQRGDLGLEMPPEKLYVAQKEIISKCNAANKPVICSSHLMTSMTCSTRIRRSDVFDVAGCIYDGADCICLTAETAIGAYPFSTVSQANDIIREAEAATMQRPYYDDLVDRLTPSIEPKVGIAMAACFIASKIRASAIIVITSSGKSAQLVSWFRPRCIVIGITRFERTARQMNIWRAVAPIHFSGPRIKDCWFLDVEQRVQYGITYGKEVGFIRSGDPLVVISGYGRSAGFTNFLRIVYASTEPGIFIEHPKDYYDKAIIHDDIINKRLPRNPCK